MDSYESLAVDKTVNPVLFIGKLEFLTVNPILFPGTQVRKKKAHWHNQSRSIEIVL